MKTAILARLVAAGAMLAAAAGAAPAQALKPWKHGIIAPKADAGLAAHIDRRMAMDPRRKDRDRDHGRDSLRGQRNIFAER